MRTNQTRKAYAPLHRLFFYFYSAIRTIIQTQDMRYKTALSLLGLLMLFIWGCQNTEQKNQTTVLKIAVSKGHGSASYERYGKWIKNADTTIIWIDMYHLPIDSAQKIISSCDGLLVTGGEDVNPDMHGRISEITRCGTIDYKRDTLEYMLLDYAFNHKMPVVGVCRGQQIINVFLGGNLYIDLPVDKPSDIHHRCKRSDTCKHMIDIVRGSLLEEISGVKICEVNSSHHQAIDIPANNIKVLAYAPDSVIESIGWLDTAGRSFLIGVQFHPEHLDFSHPIAGNLAKRFVKEIKKYHEERMKNE